MDWRSLGLAPTYPRPTMRVLLITACFFATVPSAEALASLPSISSSTAIAVAVVSVAAALSLVVGLTFFLMKFFKRLRRKKKQKPVPNSVVVVPASEPEPIVAPNREEEQVEGPFYEFLREWKDHTDEEKEEFIDAMVKEFPVAVSPSMAMDVLQKMLSEELNADLWMRMLRFVVMLERDLFHWNESLTFDYLRERMNNNPKNMPNTIHVEFQLFLLTEANKLLRKYGDVAEPKEVEEAGFMRFVAYLFGFLRKDYRILKLMEETWCLHGLDQTDASRAMVWGYRRFRDDPRLREQGSPSTTTESNGNHETFEKLMQELRRTAPDSRPAVGSKAQHLLFALGSGYEPDPEVGPLAYMCDEHKYSVAEHFLGIDYLWLMMGRDLVMGNAWQWMCEKELSEHRRMCERFGQEGDLYATIVDMVTKYPQDAATGEGMESFANRYSTGAINIDFAERRNWYNRYVDEKKTIGFGIYDWLMRPPTLMH